MTPAAGTNGAAQVLDSAERLMAAGQWARAVGLLTDANRQRRSRRSRSGLVTARLHTFVATGRCLADRPVAAAGAPMPSPSVDGLAEVAGERALPPTCSRRASSTTALHRLRFVQSPLPSPSRSSAKVRRALDAAEAADRAAPVSDTSPWYVPFEAGEGYDFGWVRAPLSRQVGAVLAVEAPRVLPQHRDVAGRRRPGRARRRVPR